MKNECVFDGPNYRYVLRRTWPVFTQEKGRCVWIMLNPSTADETKLDPTLTRCFRWTVNWGFREMVILNLFAFRSPHPKVMQAASDPIGPRNDEHILRECMTAKRIVAAWGLGGAFMARDARMEHMLLQMKDVEIVCLRKTSTGYPIHPLARGTHRVPDNIQPIPFP